MAEFCLDCYNKECGTQYTKKDVVISEELELCETCGQWKPVVVCFRYRGLSGLWKRIYLRLEGWASNHCSATTYLRITDNIFEKKRAKSKNKFRGRASRFFYLPGLLF